MRADLALLRHLSARELTARWPYAYNLLVLAQPPGFRLHLHCLRAVALPEELRAVLEPALAFFPLIDEAQGSPPDLAGGAPPAGADGALPAVAAAGRQLRAFLDEGGEASAEVLSWAFCEASDLRDELDAALRPRVAAPQGLG